MELNTNLCMSAAHYVDDDNLQPASNKPISDCLLH